MVKFLLEFDNKTYIYNNINNINNINNVKNNVKNNLNNNINNVNNNINNVNLTLLDVFIQTLSDTDKHNLKQNINHYYFIHNNKLIKYQTFVNDIIIDNNYNNKIINNACNTIKCLYKVKGGIPGLMDAVDAIINIIFKPIIAPFEDIGELFVKLLNLVIWLAMLTWWLLQFILWVVLDLLNPLNFLGDFFNTLIILVLAICRIPVDIFMTLLSFSVNLMGTWMQGFWGWDQSGLTKNDRESKYFKNLNKNKGKKCYLTNSNTVPFSVVLGTILCPPIGVFMDMGLTGWLNIIVCIFLTLLFYIPGLVYALLVIYS
jgi:uncharacterized membrane protein YqaE (UPF0057 family)